MSWLVPRPIDSVVSKTPPKSVINAVDSILNTPPDVKNDICHVTIIWQTESQVLHRIISRHPSLSAAHAVRHGRSEIRSRKRRRNQLQLKQEGVRRRRRTRHARRVCSPASTVGLVGNPKDTLSARVMLRDPLLHCDRFAPAGRICVTLDLIFPASTKRAISAMRAFSSMKSSSNGTAGHKSPPPSVLSLSPRVIIHHKRLMMRETQYT